MDEVVLIVSIAAALAAIGAFIVAALASRQSARTSDKQIKLQGRVTAIEEERRTEEVEHRRMLPASAVHAWEAVEHGVIRIYVHNTAEEPVYDVVCWAWPLLLDAPPLSGNDGVVEWPDFPDFPATQYLWVGSLGPGEKRTARYGPTEDEQRYEPVGTLFEIEFTDGRRRDWNRSHDGTLREGFRRPYAC